MFQRLSRVVHKLYLRESSSRPRLNLIGITRDESGSVAIMLAIALVPLIGFAGLALDYARLSLAKAQLQAAVDSAGLAVAHLPRDASIALVEQKALEWINIRLAGQGFGPVGLTAKREAMVISFQATTTMGLTLFKIFHPAPVAISARGDVSWSIGKVEIALVLDNTGSMVQNNSPKLKNLKAAATSLINQLESAASDPGQVKVGVVPFSMTVNVGPKYQTASWIDQAGKSPISSEIFYPVPKTPVSRFTLLSQMGVAWGGCVESRPFPHDVTETAPDSTRPETLFVPYFAPDEPDSGGTYYNNYLDDQLKSSNWMELQGNVQKYNRAPKSGNSSIGYKYGPNAGCTLQPLLRLTSKLNDARTTISNMTAVGDTNIAIGVVWGWHVLSPNPPFGDGAPYRTSDPTSDLTKYIILMTDGDNENYVTSNQNASIYSGIGYIWQKRLGISGGTSAQRGKAMDDRLSTLCTNIKQTGIQIFTVRVEVNTNNSALLENCATSRDMFYNVANSADLNAIFGQIGEKITNLHLSK